MRFPLDPAGYDYRPLKQGDKGYDVYALQGSLLADLAVDGDFGPKTKAAVLAYQERHGLVRDGIAGIATQRSIALLRIWPFQSGYAIPPGLMRGQVENESGFQLGNHSSRYDDGSFDCGIVQRNTRYAPPDEGFNVIDSLEVLAKRLRSKHDEYAEYGVVDTERRLWELAAGSWNAPAWTDRLARGLTLTAAQSAAIERYIDRATVYLVIR